MKTVPIILNPAAGGGAGRRHRAEIEQELAKRGIAYRILETSGPGSATAIAREQVRAGAAVVAVAGGDGTIHEAANGMLQARAGSACALALIPVGTGNDFVKVVPGTRTRSAAYDTIARGQPRLFDVGRASWQGEHEYFVNGMGTGIDVQVVRQMQKLPQLPGPLKYLLALVKALVNFRPVALRVRFDGSTLEQRVMIIAVGNGTCQGGGFYLAPDAKPNDGLLDLCLVRALNLPGIVRVLPRILRGTQRGDPAVEMRTVRSVRLEATDERPFFFHLDGELREPDGLRALDVEIVPSALPVLAGAEVP